jgi:hypothetical protein
MKVKLMSLVIAAFLFFSCGTTYTSTSDNAAYNVTVPAGIRSSFSAQYPDATTVVWNNYDAATVPVDWELNGWTALDNDDYAVTFNMGNDKYYSWYDANGNWIGSAYSITDYSKLPYVVNTMLKDKYNTYTIESVEKESWGNQTAYEVKLKNSDDSKLKLLVDADGNILKQKAD